MYGCQRTTLQCHFSSFTFTWVLGTKLKLLEFQSRQVPLPVEPFRQPRTKDFVASYMSIRHVHRMFHSLCTLCTGLFYPHFQETGEQLIGKIQYSTHQPPLGSIRSGLGTQSSVHQEVWLQAHIESIQRRKWCLFTETEVKGVQLGSLCQTNCHHVERRNGGNIEQT